MKKFISMVMAAAMVVSLVPATAFAADEATFKVVNDKEYTEIVAEDYNVDKNGGTGLPAGPELQIKVKDVDSTSDEKDSWDIKLHLNGAEVLDNIPANLMAYVKKGEPLNDA
ncbi:MAG: hypothetical protein IJY76_03570 [Anaerotignum sp.]|nr:hypothetical protein [Anaerotignum sp.]